MFSFPPKLLPCLTEEYTYCLHALPPTLHALTKDALIEGAQTGSTTGRGIYQFIDGGRIARPTGEEELLT